MSRFLTAQQHN